MKEATGKYILFLDCDDFFEPDMVEKAFRKAEEDSAEIVIYKSDQYNMDTQEYIYEDWAMIEWALPPYEPFSHRQISTNIFRAFVGWAWDKLYLREFVLENNLEFQQQRTTNDALFVFSALVLAKRISTVREILIHRRVDTTDSLSKTREKSWDNFYKMLLALREFLKSHGRYEELEKDYINYALHFSLWNYNTLAEPTRTKLRETLLDGWFEELGVSGKAKDYFYDQYEYSQYELMKHKEETESRVSEAE
jgi:glycosyltransferase involved in cell wall biosynthesis